MRKNKRFNNERPATWTPHENGPGELTARLERLSDVRRNVVARGKALVADPAYPNKETTRAIAGLLASKWRQ